VAVSSLSLLLLSALTHGAKFTQQAHHIVVVLSRWREALDDPAGQIGVGAIEQSLETLQLRAVRVSELGIGKSAENEVAFLRAAMPGPEQQTPAAGIPKIVPRLIHDAEEIADHKPFPS
jgi:hypothetical protein